MQQTIATHLQMPIVTDLGKYLGMPLLTTRKTNNAFKPLVDRINNKIRHWQSKLLSQAGNCAHQICSITTSLLPDANYYSPKRSF